MAPEGALTKTYVAVNGFRSACARYTWPPLTNSPEASPNTMQVWPLVIVDVAVRQLKIVLVDVTELLAGLLRKRKAPGVQFSIDDE